MAAPSAQPSNYMALDVGAARIGVAVATSIARLPHPLVTLHNNQDLMEELTRLSHQEAIGTVVVGLPRGLDGQETAQTVYCRDFADRLGEHLGVPVALQDEALTSHMAKAELGAGNKPFIREHIDALAAVYILDDYLKEHPV